jgi:hypothetical protein
MALRLLLVMRSFFSPSTRPEQGHREARSDQAETYPPKISIPTSCSFPPLYQCRRRDKNIVKWKERKFWTSVR